MDLKEIYANRCALVVVCISGRYGEKSWPLAEYEATQPRLMKGCATGDRRECFAVLPIRVDDGDVEDFRSDVIVPDAREKGVEGIAELILDRLSYVQSDAGHGDDSQLTRHVYLAEATPDMDGLRDRMGAFLKALGWSVPPTEPYGEDECQTRLAADLHHCGAFVQLLGPMPLDFLEAAHIAPPATLNIGLADDRIRDPLNTRDVNAVVRLIRSGLTNQSKLPTLAA